MLSALVIAQEKAPVESIEGLASQSKQVSVQKTLNQFPSTYELVRLLNSYDPDLVFLELTDHESALSLAEAISSQARKVSIIGFGGQSLLRQAAQYAEAGVAELLVSPVDLGKFLESIYRAIHKVRAGLVPNLLAFLPAKAGSGATTIALNVGGCLANALNKKVLLIEGDLHSGVLSVLLNCALRGSLLDVLENSIALDSSLWTNCVVQTHGMDLLLTNRSQKKMLPDWTSYYKLLEFAVPLYDFIIIDLPEVVNDATREAVRRAAAVYVVSTPELPALKLAEQRCEGLKAGGVPSDRIHILLNRWLRGAVTPNEVEQLLKQPVPAVFGNDYASVYKAILGSQLVNPKTKVGSAFLAFARKVAGLPAVKPGLFDKFGLKK